jgi:hypothetical protein
MKKGGYVLLIGGEVLPTMKSGVLKYLEAESNGLLWVARSMNVNLSNGVDYLVTSLSSQNAPTDVVYWDSFLYQPDDLAEHQDTIERVIRTCMYFDKRVVIVGRDHAGSEMDSVAKNVDELNAVSRAVCNKYQVRFVSTLDPRPSNIYRAIARKVLSSR